MSVPQVKLGELMRTEAASIDPRRFPDEQFDLLSIPAFDMGHPEVLLGSDIGSAKQIVRPGDVLLSRIVPHIRRAWPVPQANGHRQIASGEWIVFRSQRIDPSYMRHLLVSDDFHSRFMMTVAGVGGSLLRARPAHVAEIAVPIPPLGEQRRIAAILDQADALRAKRRAALPEIDALAKTIFANLFGDPVSNPRNWDDRKTLGDVADLASGITKGRRPPGGPLRVVPYLAVSNVQDHSLNLSVVKTIEAGEDEIARYRLQVDDIVVTEGGDPDKLGRGVLWKGEIAECIHQNHIFRIRVTAPTVHPLYLVWLIGSSRGKRYFLRAAKQTTGIASINMGQLRGFPLLIPPFDLQCKFVKAMDGLAVLRQRANEAKTELDSLFAALQHRAFRGEL